jgi:hypothetical protein
MKLSLAFRSCLAAVCVAGAVSTLVGCAAPTADEPNPDPAGHETVAQTSQPLSYLRDPSRNCWWIDWIKGLTCTTMSAENVFNKGAYQLVTLDAKRNEKLTVTNNSPFPVTLFVAQGFNVTAQHKSLAPGESTVMQRIDDWTWTYDVLARIDANLDETFPVRDLYQFCQPPEGCRMVRGRGVSMSLNIKPFYA